jgi:peptide/nickel transport system permease protein
LKKLFKQPTFLIGFIFIFGLLILSFLYSWFWADNAKKIIVLYTKSGDVIGKAPFGPNQVFPFGTDSYGHQLAFTILDGAKYTILFSLTIGLLRTVIGLIIGIFVSVTPIKIKSSPSTMLQALQTVPISLVLYVILQPVIFDTDHYVYYKNIFGYAGSMYGKPPHYSMWATILFETFLLTMISVPLVSKLFADEMRLLMKKEFVLSSKTLGSSKWFQIKKHVLPHMWPKIYVVFIQQIIQALLIIIHLGVLQIYFGGTYVRIYPMETDIWGKTNEWSGIIGYQLKSYGLTPWMVLFPLLFFFLLILAYNFILEGINKAQNTQEQSMKIVESSTEKSLSKNYSIPKKDFNFLNSSDHYSNF